MECIRIIILDILVIGYHVPIILYPHETIDSRYDQLSNPNWSLELVLMHGGND